MWDIRSAPVMLKNSWRSGGEVDHSTMTRWVIKYSSQLEAALHRRKRHVWLSWRMDETYMKVKDEWKYLYCAVDK
jgi:putative transposase